MVVNFRECLLLQTIHMDFLYRYKMKQPSKLNSAHDFTKFMHIYILSTYSKLINLFDKASDRRLRFSYANNCFCECSVFAMFIYCANCKTRFPIKYSKWIQMNTRAIRRENASKQQQQKTMEIICDAHSFGWSINFDINIELFHVPEQI